MPNQLSYTKKPENKTLKTAGLFVTVASIIAFSGCGDTPSVEIIAHRGASHIAPENTVVSANAAWENGADAVEVDIYLSADGKIMVIHDSTTKRTTGSDYKVGETDSGILRSLDAGSWKGTEFAGEKIPFLEEIIETVPRGKRLYVEIKFLIIH